MKFAECNICLFRISVNDVLSFLNSRVLTFSILEIFDDPFIDYLFDLVEQTRYMPDDTFNYSVVKLIVSMAQLGPGCKLPTQTLQVALNEEFMVAGLGGEVSPTSQEKNKAEESAEPKNRIIRVMMRRLGSCRTFGENMIFMLNRTS